MYPVHRVDEIMTEIHSYDPKIGHGLRHDPFYSIVGPRPIGWISSLDKNGQPNLAPYSFFNAFCDEPCILGFCSNGWKDTVSNIADTKEFVWNLATRPNAEAMNATSASVAHEVDEFALAGLKKLNSVRVRPFRVEGSPVTFECVATQIVQLKNATGLLADAWMVFGEVVYVHIDRRMIVEGVYNTALAQPILRAGGSGEYVEVRSDIFFKMRRPR
jgi:flavin reductase (DIM6/NTAB) family NADH-FMN oxidoreductase RutF